MKTACPAEETRRITAMNQYDNVIGYIEYLDNAGCVQERLPYVDAEEFKTRIYASLYCGEPIIPVVFPENLSQPLTFEKGTIFPWGLRSEKPCWGCWVWR